MAAPLSINLLFDTLELVRRFHSSTSFKKEFLSRIKSQNSLYQNRPVKDYLNVITKYLSADGKSHLVTLTDENVTSLLREFYETGSSQGGFNKLLAEYSALRSGEISVPEAFSKEEHDKIVEGEKEKIKKDEKERTSRERVVTNTSSSSPDKNPEVKEEEVTRTIPTVEQIPYPVRKIGADTESFIAIKLSKLLKKIPGLTWAGTGVGAVAGAIWGGPQGAPVGMVVGAVIGTLTHEIAKSNRPEPVADSSAGIAYDSDDDGDIGQSSMGDYSSGSPTGLSRGVPRSLKPSFPINSRLLSGARGLGVRSLATRGLIGGAISAFGGPTAAIIAAILLGGLVLMILFGIISSSTNFPPYGGNNTGTSTPTSNKLTISKTGPTAVGNGEDISYEISVTYNGTGTAEVELTDKLPEKTIFKSATDDGVNGNGIIKWSLSGISPGNTKRLVLVVSPTEADIWVVNEGATGTITKTNVPTGTTPDISSINGITDFNVLMKGQGRNTNILGDENNFAKVTESNGSIYVGGKEEYVRTIYKAAVARNVNPLAILSIWGTETGFRLGMQNVALSCPVREQTSFESQANCAAKTYDFWMRDFEQRNRDGVLAINQKCSYDDPFIYATEKYGPTCVVYDGNDFFLKNFVIYYKKFLGAE